MCEFAGEKEMAECGREDVPECVPEDNPDFSGREAAAEQPGPAGDFLEALALLRELKTAQESMACDIADLKAWMISRQAEDSGAKAQESGVEDDKAVDGSDQTALVAEGFARLETGLEKLGGANRAALDAFNDFRSNLSRDWHDELKHYRELFAMGAYDNLLKKLAEIYIALFNLCREKNDASFTSDMEWTVLEPLRELMENYGVTVQETEPGKKRSARSMRSVRQKPTADKALDGLVARSVAPGFLREGENDGIKVVLMPEEVEHYSWRENFVEKDGEEAGEGDGISQ